MARGTQHNTAATASAAPASGTAPPAADAQTATHHFWKKLTEKRGWEWLTLIGLDVLIPIGLNWFISHARQKSQHDLEKIPNHQTFGEALGALVAMGQEDPEMLQLFNALMSFLEETLTPQQRQEFVYHVAKTGPTVKNSVEFLIALARMSDDSVRKTTLQAMGYIDHKGPLDKASEKAMSLVRMIKKVAKSAGTESEKLIFAMGSTAVDDLDKIEAWAAKPGNPIGKLYDTEKQKWEQRRPLWSVFMPWPFKRRH